MSRTRGFVFTWNNPSLDPEAFLGWMTTTGNTKYVVFGEEVGASGTPHYQGYVEFVNPRGLKGVISQNKHLGMHWEIRKGTPLQAMTYCKKDGKFHEFGEAPTGQGERTDVKSITSAIVEGKSNREILLGFGDKALRMSRMIDWARQELADTVRNWEMDVRIYYGIPGSGKTKAVWDEFPNVYPKMVNKWWCGYSGQECVVFDDFDPKNCFDTTFDFYLKLLDRYPMMIEYKGGSRHFTSKTIIFTSNFDPQEWFVDKTNRSAFFRRVKVIRGFFEKYSEHSTEVSQGNTRPDSPVVDYSEESDKPWWVAPPQTSGASLPTEIPYVDLSQF